MQKTSIFSKKSAFLKLFSTEIGRFFFLNSYFLKINTISTVSERFENEKGSNFRKNRFLCLKMLESSQNWKVVFLGRVIDFRKTEKGYPPRFCSETRFQHQNCISDMGRGLTRAFHTFKNSLNWPIVKSLFSCVKKPWE